MEKTSMTLSDQIIDNSTKDIDSTWKKQIAYVVVCNAAFVLYGKNQILNYIVIIIFTFFMIYGTIHKFLELFYIPLVFFEQVLILPTGGSFFVVYEVFFGLYLIYKYKAKIPITKKVIVFLIYFVMCLLYSGTKAIISIFINISIIYVISICFLNNRSNREQFFIVLALSGFFSGLYGFINVIGENYGYGIRYVGSISDPNYSALLYVLGLAGACCCTKIPKWYRICLISFIFFFLLRTISVTGCATGVIIVLLITYFRNRNRGFLFAIAGVALILVFFNMNLSASNPLYGIHTRIVRTVSSLRARDFMYATSGRSGIAEQYISYFINNLSFSRQLFGGLNPIGGEFRNYMVGSIGTVSHNSFIDMLYMNGIIGTLFILFCLGKDIRFNILKFQETNDNTYLGFVMIKITILIFAFFISIYTYKYFNLGFLI